MAPDQLSPAAIEFLTERHLGTLTTLRADGSPHVVAIGFTYEAEHSLVRVITSAASAKVANAARGERAAVCQVDGRRWLTLEGVARINSDAAAVAEAVRRYTTRYRQPKVRDDRVVIEIVIDRVLAGAKMSTP
jgi:F420H(2)-dependent biliverdin reductase